MELKEFVSNTLIEIISGVEEAQKNLTDRYATAAINPSPRDLTDGKNLSLDKKIADIEFDVALCVGKSNSAGGKISVIGGIIGGSAQDSKSKAEEFSHRIKFSVPVRWS